MAASVLDYASDVKKIFFNKGALPTQLIYYVTNRCNAKCHHCFFWDELNVPMNELTLEEIRQITKTLTTAGSGTSSSPAMASSKTRPWKQ